MIYIYFVSFSLKHTTERNIWKNVIVAENWWWIQMTVSYALQCSTHRFGNFLRLLFLWRGSIYKLLYKDLTLFLLAYFALSLSYRFVLDPQQCNVFEKLVSMCLLGQDMIPLTFVLGFFVTLILDRWWNNFLAIPWPDRWVSCKSTI